MRWLLASRPLNLIIVFLTQYLFYHKYILSELAQSVLYPKLLIPFITVTTLITAGGYYINDYFDFEADVINGKRHRLSQRIGYLLLYGLVTMLGLFLSIWIAMEVGETLLTLIYVLAIAGLFWYSVSLKGKGIFGNLFVALFSALVIPILIFAERNYLGELTHNPAVVIGIPLSTFIFFISFVRELVKDIEDMEGDTKLGLSTFPISAGVDRTKVVCTINLFFFLGVFFSTLYYLDFNSELLVFSTFLVILPVLILIYLIHRASTKKSFRHLSIYLKLLMLSGLILFFFVI